MVVVDNAIILAAGTSSRFAPLSYEKPKSLFSVKGEVLIERQIRQLREAGIKEIIIVVGYMKEQFNYLKEKYDVILVENNDYLNRNNNGSIFAVRNYLNNSYVCSSDNYFIDNPFEKEVDGAYYAALYSSGPTNEWCISTDNNGLIEKVVVGGKNSWYMMGHTFWDSEFSKSFLKLLVDNYKNDDYANMLWEEIYAKNIKKLNMKIRKYPRNSIFEFDTLDDLRKFDNSYYNNTRSSIIKEITRKLMCEEKDIINLVSFNDGDNSAAGFCFELLDKKYKYYYKTNYIEEVLL